MKKKNILIIIVAVVLMTSNGYLQGEEGKFQIELSGNYIFVNPEHLNYLTISEQQYLAFYFDNIYSGKSEDGSLKSIESTQTFTTRLKFGVSSSIRISVGLSYLWKKLSSPYSVSYFRNESWRTITDDLYYTELDTKLTGFIPSIGLHYHLSLSKSLGVELSMAGGPLFISIDYHKTVAQILTSKSEQTFPIYSSEKNLRLDGKGTGVSLSGSIKLKKSVYKSIGISLEGGYTWQRVNNIKGGGLETIDGYSTNFEGEWGLVKEHVQTAWGEAEFVFPTSNWVAFKQKSEDFILDLSGIYISIGIHINL